MKAIEIIEKKRDGNTLTTQEITFLLQNYLQDTIPDYQMSAFLMAVYYSGLDSQELLAFTKTMSTSGDTITLPSTSRFIIDKHSTGGVGDKTSIALTHLLSVMDMGIAKLTGRGLGHTGGTIDKFESIPGFHFSDNPNDMALLMNKHGMALLGYSDAIVPLDKKLYTLRDVTATVASIPLIASSIMSKKLAVNTDAIILDIKVGNGAFMQDISSAKTLAHTMHDIGVRAGRKVVCILSDMNQPLGHAIGNANECIEAIETLKGNGPQDFVELVTNLAGVAAFLKGTVISVEAGVSYAKTFLVTQTVLDALRNFISYSGGNASVVDDYNLFPSTIHQQTLLAQSDGYVYAFNTKEIRNASMMLGAGRSTKESTIDHGTGIEIIKKISDTVKKGEVLAKLYTNTKETLQHAYCKLQHAIIIKEIPIDKPKSVVLKYIY